MSDLSLVLYSFSLVLRICSTDLKFATFTSILQLAAKVQYFSELCKFFANYFPRNRKKNSRRGEWQFPKERAATSLHKISKQAPRAPAILEIFKYSSIQVGQECFRIVKLDEVKVLIYK